MVVNTLCREESRNEKYAFHSFDSRDILIWLKHLALEPCNMRPSHQKNQNQMFIVRKLLNASAKRPQRKRKFYMGENDSELASTFGLISTEKYGHQNAENLRGNGSSSSVSGSPIFKEKCVSMQGTRGQVAFPALDDGVECCNICRQDYSLLCDRAEQCGSLPGRAKYCSGCRQDFSPGGDYDESIKRPNPMTQGNLKGHSNESEIGSNFTHSSKTSSIKEEPNTEILNVVKSFADEEFDDPSEASHSLSSETEDGKLNQPRQKFLPFRSNPLPRPVIPIGPRFQAEVPKWECKTNVRRNACDDLKWLGTQIWPIPHITETNTIGVGKGRSDACGCDIPGSVDCVRQHISEARKLLQFEIGAAYSNWMLVLTGEDVSKSWTSKEQKEFESLAKVNLPSEDTDFWKLAREHFPAKSMKNMVNYYYNVYIPRRMSMETRSSFDELDSDNDQNEDYRNEGGCSTTRIGIVPICKLLKSRIRNRNYQ